MANEIKTRIEQINRGEVPQGYKKTKVGIVPQEWEETLFATLFESISQYTNNLIQYPLYSLTIEEGITAKTERYERSHLVKKDNSYKVVRPNDYAYNPMNIRFGAVARHSGDIPVSVSGYYDIFTTKNQDDLFFMDNFLTCDAMLTYYNKVATGSLIEKQRVHFSRFLEFNLPLPAVDERKTIADILTTQDKVIQLKEKLIGEKQKQKKYLMQNLLTGKTCLKGFTDEWQKVKLGECLVENTERNKNLEVTNVLSVSNKFGFISQNEQFGKEIASKDLSDYKIIDKNYIAYNPSRINVGSIALYDKYEKGIVSPMYIVIKVKNNINIKFFMSFVATYTFNEKMKKLLSGSVRDSLNYSDLCSIDISLPPLPEQNAIAEILSTADKEIELLQRQLQQEEQKKKALMQLLLTGIVRV